MPIPKNNDGRRVSQVSPRAGTEPDLGSLALFPSEKEVRPHRGTSPSTGMRVAELRDFQTERPSGSGSRKETPVRMAASQGLVENSHRPMLPLHPPESRRAGSRATLAAVAILVVVAPFVTTDLSTRILRGPLKSNQIAASEKPTVPSVNESPTPTVAAVPAAVAPPEPESSPNVGQPAEPVRVTPGQPPAATQQRATTAARVDAPAAPGASTSDVAVDRPKFQGNLSIESQSAGAQVWIDSKPAGVTPLVDWPLAAGSHVVRLELDGYARWSGVVQIVTGKTLTLTPTLQPLPRTEAPR